MIDLDAALCQVFCKDATGGKRNCALREQGCLVLESASWHLVTVLLCTATLVLERDSAIRPLQNALLQFNAHRYAFYNNVETTGIGTRSR